MRNRPGQQLAAVIVWLVGVCLLILPESVTSRLRSVTWDVALPGEQLVDSTIRQSSNLLFQRPKPVVSPETDARIVELENQLRELRMQNRQLKIQQGLIPPRIRASSDGTAPLIIPDLLSARVIGRELSRVWNEQPVLNRGSTHGARPDLLVLDKERINLDVGKDLDVRPDSPVYAGRMVVGRVAQVGLFTSSVRLITDAQYRGEAGIFHDTGDTGKQLRPISHGIISGDGGKGCRLLNVSPSDPVEVGDWVFTAEGDGILPHAMCYGRISRAVLKPGAVHWEIDVTPAVAPEQLREVTLLRTRLNSERFTQSPALASRRQEPSE